MIFIIRHSLTIISRNLSLLSKLLVKSFDFKLMLRFLGHPIDEYLNIQANIREL